MTAPVDPEGWVWPSTVISDVVDGDTVDALLIRQVDLGFYITSTVSFPMRLRLNRIDAYPSNTTRGRRAKALVQARTGGVLLTATTIKPYKYAGPKKRVAEWMVELVLADGTNVSDLLVAEGLAVYWDGAGPRPAVDSTT